MWDYLGLTLFYGVSVVVLVGSIFYSYRQRAFSLHLLFSVIYLITFFLGYPFSLILTLGFDVALQPQAVLFYALGIALLGYLIYFVSYQLLYANVANHQHHQYVPLAKLDAKTTACLLMIVAIGTVACFLYFNGLLLFKLEKYSQIFSANVKGVALKRFFYFFIPALLIFYFLREDKKAWLGFLFLGVGFGVLTYLAVGGTRANIALAFALFFFIGLYQGYLSIVWLIIAGIVAIVAMFLLALARYGLNVSGTEAFYTFLYLTRDTFSPWENFALLLNNKVEHQGLMPIVRDFYVFIPKSLWTERPDQILNAANYFTWEVLENHSGLAISPTLLGSFYIMGGLPMIGLGMAFLGILVYLFDRLLIRAERLIDGRGAIWKAYCFANLFNLIVLVREGADAFFSRFVFFSVVFGSCLLLSVIMIRLMVKMQFIQEIKEWKK